MKKSKFKKGDRIYFKKSTNIEDLIALGIFRMDKWILNEDVIITVKQSYDYGGGYEYYARFTNGDSDEEFTIPEDYFIASPRIFGHPLTTIFK